MNDLARLAKNIEQAMANGEIEGHHPVARDFPTPSGWRVLQRSRSGDGVMWRVPGGKLRVVASASLHGDDVWAHVSVSTKSGQLPTWPEMVMVRDAVLGDDVEAYQICPPAGRYVNLSQVLHWWACLDKPEGVLPQFDAVVAGVRTI